MERYACRKRQYFLFKCLIEQDRIPHHTAGSCNMPYISCLFQAVAFEPEIGSVKEVPLLIYYREVTVYHHRESRCSPFLPLHFRHGKLQLIVLPNIILVTKGNILRTAQRDTLFKIPDKAQRFTVPVQPDHFIPFHISFDQFNGTVRRAIVTNDQFYVPVGLCKYRVYLFCYEFFTVIGRQYDRNKGLRIIFHGIYRRHCFYGRYNRV